MPRSRGSGPLRVASFPPPLETNPYQQLLHAALRRRGVSFVEVPARLSPLGVWRARHDVDVVHLHWLELLAFAHRPALETPRNLLRATQLWLALLTLALSGVRVVWTVHNARPHEPRHPRAYRLLARTAATVADAILVHSRHAAVAVARDLRPRGEVVVAYHGPYTGWYAADDRPVEDVRHEIGVPAGAFTYLMFGMVRRYKRVPDAVRAFSAFPADDVRLVVAGSVHDEGLREELESLAAADPRVVLHLRWIGDEEVGTFHRAASAVVLAHREIFSSGALILAWSFGVPVVAPAGGALDELAVPGAVEAFGEGELTRSLLRARKGDPQQRSAAARSAAERHTWEQMADAVLRAYGRSS
jgi:glycosyltransferase involved in cell wall biosynthesis